jgi:hypothetical protein
MAMVVIEIEVKDEEMVVVQIDHEITHQIVIETETIDDNSQL